MKFSTVRLLANLRGKRERQRETVVFGIAPSEAFRPPAINLDGPPQIVSATRSERDIEARHVVQGMVRLAELHRFTLPWAHLLDACRGIASDSEIRWAIEDLTKLGVIEVTVEGFRFALASPPTAPQSGATSVSGQVLLSQRITDEIEALCDCDAYRANEDDDWHTEDCPTEPLREALDRAAHTGSEVQP